MTRETTIVVLETMELVEMVEPAKIMHEQKSAEPEWRPVEPRIICPIGIRIRIVIRISDRGIRRRWIGRRRNGIGLSR